MSRSRNSLSLAACVSISSTLSACAGLPSSAKYSFREERDRVYKNADNIKLTADFFIPEIPGPKPAVLVVHGGGWTKRAGDMEWICKDLARAGFVAVNITYRLAPGSVYPKAVDDIRDATHWLKAHAAEYEIDSSRIAGWGYSAGANLVLLAGLDPKLGMKAVVAGGAPADLTVWPKSSEVKKFIGHPLDSHGNLWAEASPINHVRADSPPVFLYHGEWDWIVSLEQLRKMQLALHQKKVPHESYIAPKMGHLLVYLFSQESLERGVEFLRRKMQ